MKAIIAMLMAGLLVPAAAVAQEWQPYTYPDPGFAIQFPGVPAVQRGTIKNATGVSLPMTRYAVRAAHITYTLSVVNYASTNADALSTIAETERSLAESGKVTAASGARIGRNFGRRMNLSGTDGSRSAIAIFFVNRHLYTVVGQALAPNADEESGDAGRFQQSLRFPEDASSGGFFGLFGGGGSDSDSSGYGGSGGSGGSSGSSGSSGSGSSGGSGGSAGASSAIGAGEGRARVAGIPHADATCAGKSPGDPVQLQTPGGPVAATCFLVARPNPPPSAPPNAP